MSTTETDLGQLASLARTALDDPLALPDGKRLGVKGSDEALLYAIDRLDDIIRITDPLDEPEPMAVALEALGRALVRISEQAQSTADARSTPNHEKLAYGVVEEQVELACDALDTAAEHLRDAAGVVLNDCEDCAVNGDDCRTHGEAFREAHRAVLEDPERVLSLLRGGD